MGNLRKAIAYILYARNDFRRYGYVRWSDIAKQFECSRQSISIALKDAALNSNYLSIQEYETWRKSWQRLVTRSFRITPENLQWLDTESARRQIRTESVLNELLTTQRFISSTQSQSHDNNHTDQDNKSD